jgi:hypothetical protein
MGFYFLETAHTWFHLDETPLISFSINFFCHVLKILCGRLFIENKTHIGSSTKPPERLVDYYGREIIAHSHIKFS